MAWNKLKMEWFNIHCCVFVDFFFLWGGGGGEGVELKVANVYFCLFGGVLVKRAISGVNTLSS